MKTEFIAALCALLVVREGMSMPRRRADADTTKPMQVCLGGLDQKSTESLPQAKKEHADRLPEYKKAGVSSHELYVRWNMIEPAKGKFDFSYFDELQKMHGEYGVKWVPFLIAGSAYTLPNWFYKGPDHLGYVCLEHGTESDIQTLWNPAMRGHCKRVITAFCKHYNGRPEMESVLLGITGNYGESIYPASGLDWTQDAHGPYHTHTGWWFGDKHAVRSFQDYMKEKFASVRALNKELGTTFTSWNDVRPLLPEDWPSSAGLQLQALWGQDSMNDYADFWMKTAKDVMPDTDVYLVVGGHAPNRHGMDISAQAKLAAKRGCGIRITNEVDPFAYNFALTRMVPSSCRLYGTFYSIEPAGPMTEKGVAARAFNATASGARCLHYYEPNILGSPAQREKWEKARPFVRERDPLIDVAVFYPRRWMNLREDEQLVGMLDDFTALRNASDYDMLDERMLDEYVSRGRIPYRALIMRDDWVEDRVSSASLKRFTKAFPKCEVIKFSGQQTRGKETEKFLAELSKQLHPEDDFTSAVYFARFTDDTILFLNQTGGAIDLQQTHPRMVKKPTPVGPWEMAEIKID